MMEKPKSKVGEQHIHHWLSAKQFVLFCKKHKVTFMEGGVIYHIGVKTSNLKMLKKIDKYKSKIKELRRELKIEKVRR